jgi:tetratricopeptide (TPR) repeat protein
MPKISKFVAGEFVVLFAFLFAPLFTLAAQTDVWISLESKNFRLVGNAPEKDLRLTAMKLEQFRRVFSALFGDLNFASPIPTTVLVFKDKESFQPFQPLYENGTSRDFVSGYFVPGKDVNYIALSTADVKNPGFPTVFHEYTHFLIDNNLGRTNIPPWFNEGFAEYYEQYKIADDRRVTLGAINEAHLKLLRENGLQPLEKIFAVDYYTLNRQPKEEVVSFYAQSWLIIHYLMHADKASAEQLAQFGALRVKGIAAKEAFERAFQTDYATLENNLKKYLTRKSFTVSVLDFENKIIYEGEMRVSRLREAEVLAFQGDLLNHGNRLGEAAVYLQRALALEPELGFANTSFGLLKTQQKDFAEARKYLKKAVEFDAENYLAHFAYAYVLSRDGMTDFGFIAGYKAADANEVRASLRRAIQLNPNYAESYQLYAYVNIVRNENIAEGFQMINKALEIAPGNQMYNLRRAELYMRKEEFSLARQITAKILQTVSDDQMKLYAENTISLINSWQAQLESIKNQNLRKRENPAVTDKPLSEEEIQRRNELAMMMSLNESLRRPRADEKRVVGSLAAIDCGGKGIVYTVKTADESLQLANESINDVILTGFTAEFVNLKFGCGNLKNEMFAVVTFRADASETSKVKGELIAVEFVPKNFRFMTLADKEAMQKEGIQSPEYPKND